MKNLSQPDTVTPYERQAELRRILESKYFAKAPKRRLFLEFTSGRALLGEGEKLNEYLIGVEVYERGTEFDPQQDPIVRVQAHEIRRALKNYYQAEGKNSPLRIELPPGQYAPVFSRAKPDSENSATPNDSEESFGWGNKRVAVRWQTVLLVCLGLACAALSLLFARERALSRQPPAKPATLLQESGWFWKPFLSPGSQPLVVVPNSPVLRLGTQGDSPRVLGDGYVIPKSKLSAFQDTPHFRELKTFTFVPSTADYTGIGEALGLVNLLKLFASQGATIRVKPSRLADYSEIQAGNTIMLGGGNHWTNRVLLDPQGFSASQNEGVIKNPNPGAGEHPIYAPQFDPVTNNLVRDYALILMQPNHTKEERLLCLYGLYTQGTEAAAEYVTSVEGLAELRKALVAASPDKKSLPSFFEALLSVPVENNVPGGASVVAVKINPQ